MKLLALRFLPRSGYTTQVESFTIFGTFCWGYRLIFGEKKLLELLERFLKEPPFLISSPIFCGDGEYFFPAPQLPARFESRRELELALTEGKGEAISSPDRKLIKKLRFIPWKIMKEVLDGGISTLQDLKRAYLTYTEKQQKTFPEVFPRIIIRNSINRLTNTTLQGKLANITIWHYPSFLILLLLKDESFDTELFLYIFNRFSLGGRKSSGVGASRVLIETPQFNLEPYLQQISDYIYTLSPTFLDRVFLLENSYYIPFVYFGRIENFYFNLLPTVLKERVFYFKSGSVLCLKERKDVYGGFKVVARDLSGKTDIQIYQYGYAFPLYIKNLRVEALDEINNPNTTSH